MTVRLKFYSSITSLLLSFLCLTTAVAQEGISFLNIGALSQSGVGSFPLGWRTWPLQRSKAERIYKIAEDNGQKYISAIDTEGASQQIFFNFNWNLETRPNLIWKWRATSLPEGANESIDSKNDSACGIYVVFGKYQGDALKDVWSNSLPKDTMVPRRDGNLK